MHDSLFLGYADVYADVAKMILDREVGSTEIKPPLISSYRQEPMELKNQICEAKRMIACEKQKIQINMIGVGQYADRDLELPIKVYCRNQDLYEQQLQKEVMILCPIESMVLYFGFTKWSGPVTLSEIMEVPESVQSYFTDYEVRLLDVGALSQCQVKQFTSDFYIVADYLSQMRRQGIYHPSTRSVEHPEALVDFMIAVTRNPLLQLSDLITTSSL